MNCLAQFLLSILLVRAFYMNPGRHSNPRPLQLAWGPPHHVVVFHVAVCPGTSRRRSGGTSSTCSSRSCAPCCRSRACPARWTSPPSCRGPSASCRSRKVPSCPSCLQGSVWRGGSAVVRVLNSQPRGPWCNSQCPRSTCRPFRARCPLTPTCSLTTCLCTV